MDPNLTADEDRLANYFRDKGLSTSAAKIYALTLSRQYKAPEEMLADILAFFRGLEGLSRGDILAEIRGLARRGLLRYSQTERGDAYIEASPTVDPLAGTWLTLSRALLNGAEVDPSIAKLIAERVGSFEPGARLDRTFAERVDWASWPEARDALSRAVAMASETIRLGMFSSISAFAQLSQDIRDALARKVNVKLLMFSPDLAREVEHTHTGAQEVQRYLGAWRTLYQDLCREKGRDRVGQFEIRLLGDKKMVAVHRALLVDHKIWLLNIHRPGRDRGIEGLVYRGSCEEGETTIYSLLDYYWDAAWVRASVIDLTSDQITPKAVTPAERLAVLRQNLTDYFSDGELHTLCFDLGVDYEELPGTGKADKARELVDHFNRRNRIPELVAACEKERPSVLW